MTDEEYADFVRDGRIVRFTPAFWVSSNADDTSWKSWTWKVGIGDAASADQECRTPLAGSSE
jgi:hypothetical protein